MVYRLKVSGVFHPDSFVLPSVKNRPRTQWSESRPGSEEQRNECALTFEKSRSKRYAACSDVAEAVGFEPTVPCGTLDFETVPLRRHIEAVHGSYYALNPLKNQDFLSI